MMTMRILLLVLACLVTTTRIHAATPDSLELDGVTEGSDSLLCINFTAPNYCQVDVDVKCKTNDHCPRIAGAVQRCVTGDPVTPSEVTYSIRDQQTGTVLLGAVTDSAPGAPAKCYTIPAAANVVHAADPDPTGQNVGPTLADICERHVITMTATTGTLTVRREWTYCVRNLQY